MKPIKAAVTVLLAALMALALAGCFYINLNGETVIGNGDVETRDIELEHAVTGVVSQSSVDVIIDADLTGKAMLEMESNLMDLVEVEQGGDGLLTVDMKPGVAITMHKSMTLRIPAIAGGRIEANGSGNISLAEGTLTGDEFDVYIAGSGDIRLTLEAQRISLVVDGSGDTELSATADTVTADSHGSGEIAILGETRELDVNLSGSGDFNGFDLEAQNARVGVNGSGDANVYVTGELTGSTNGSGDITYDGNPQNVSISENGSGDAGPR